MITKAIEKCFIRAKQRSWDKTYWAFDIHETIIIPNYKVNSIPTEFYPNAKEVLQLISKRRDISIILYTCSHPDEISKYVNFFESNSIICDYVNENPEVHSEGYGYYEDKFYFNVLFEDKAGFEPATDWIKVKQLLIKYPEAEFIKHYKFK